MDELRALFEQTAKLAADFYDTEEGSSWMGGTTWDGRQAIRLSLSNWQTTDEDVERTLAVYAGQLAAR